MGEREGEGEVNFEQYWYLTIKSTVKVTIQFETEGNGQNEIVSHMDRSEVKLKNNEKNIVISHTKNKIFETEKYHQKCA